MQVYDMIVLFLLIAAAVWGARRGLVKQLATLLSLVLGYIVAVNFRGQVAPLVDAPEPWNQFAAMLGLFMVTSLMVWIGFRFVTGTIEKAGLTAFDTQMGGLFGLAKGLLIVMAVTMFSVVMLGESQRTSVLSSFSGYNICRLIQRANQFVPTEWQQAMQPYLDTVEEHQQIVTTTPTDIFADPFEAASPSDTGEFAEQLSRYEDSDFGAVFSNDSSPSTSVEAASSYGDLNPPTSQARLGQPVFDR